MAGPVDRIPPQQQRRHDRDQNHRPGKGPRHPGRGARCQILGPYPLAESRQGDDLADEEDAERLPEFLRHQIARKKHALDARAMLDLMRLDDFGDHRRCRNRCHDHAEQRHGHERQQQGHRGPAAEFDPPPQIAGGIGQKADHGAEGDRRDRRIALAETAMRGADSQEGGKDGKRQARGIPGKLIVGEPPDIEHHIVGCRDRRRIAGDEEQRAAGQCEKGGIAEGKQDIGEHRDPVPLHRRPRRQRDDAAMLTQCRSQRRNEDHRRAEQAERRIARRIEQPVLRRIVGF